MLQGDDDQVVPYKDASLEQHELLSNSTLKVYEGFPHGMLTTHADVINPDLLEFIQQQSRPCAGRRAPGLPRVRLPPRESAF